MKQVKVAHMSDLHYSATNLAEADRCFEDAVTKAILHGVDCAVITGDSTDHAMEAHSPAVRALAAQIQRLSDHCPVLMLQGTFSHEPPGFLRMLMMVCGKYPVSVADGISRWGLLKGSAFTRFDELMLRQYDLVVNAMPTLNKAHVALLNNEGEDDASVEARSVISGVIRSWGDQNIQCHELGIPTMVLSHGTVFHSINENGVPMAGTDHELGVDTLFEAKAHAVALGHIHKHQVWSDGPQKIAYAGSIGRFHHGEQGDKGWILWDLAPKTTGINLEFVVTPSRRNVDFVFEGPPDLEAIKARQNECVGAFVRIRYTIDEEHRQNVDRVAIRSLLETAADVQIEGRTCVVQRQRAEGISTVSLAQKLELWAVASGTPDVAGLQSRLQMIEADPAEAVAAQVVDLLTTSA